MGKLFAEIAFTPSVRSIQEAMGSRDAYARVQESAADDDELGPDEKQFIAARDSFYMASVSEKGWPYVQHRGGPPGFLKVIDATTIGFADYRGNRQYVSVGNLAKDDRVSLILVDYPNRARLKLLGHARIVSGDEPELLARLKTPGYRARVERGVMVRVAAFDWNCPQHITPRFTQAEIEPMVRSLRAWIKELEAQLQAGTSARTSRSQS